MRTFILIIALATAGNTYAESFRVNNQGNGAPFLEINPAVAAASDGDTIYVEGSPTQYANFNVSKQLVVIGEGYFLPQNGFATGGALEARTGAGTISASGAKLLGLYVNGSLSITSNTSNVIIESCRTLSGMSVNNGCSNLVIIKNFFDGSLSFSGGAGTGHIISHNYIRTGVVSTGTGPSATITHNVINHSNSTTYIGLSNSTISNNIFIRPSATVAVPPTNSVFTNNVAMGSLIPATNNTTGVELADIFVVANPSVNSPVDNNFFLAPGSPAEGAAADGSDCGMYGGMVPYRLSGLPPLPRVTGVVAPTVVSVGVPFDVSINAQSVE